MANIVRTNNNAKGKKILFKNGKFADGLNPSGYTLDGNEIKISNRDSFIMDYFEPNKLIYVKWYVPSGQANDVNMFPTLMNVKTSVYEKGGYIGFTSLLDTDFISCISSKEALQVYKGYGTNAIKIKEIWSENIGGGVINLFLKLFDHLFLRKEVIVNG